MQMILVAAVLALAGGFFLSDINCSPETKFLRSEGFQIEYVEYAPRTSTDGVVFILPPTGGPTPLDRRYAKGLCHDDRKVVIPVGWTGMDELAIDLDLHNRLFSRANRALEMLAKHYPGDLHFMGTSLGALFTISALAHIPQIKKAVLVVGGIPFTEIIAQSDTQQMVHLREERAKHGLIAGPEDYIAKLNAVFRWNDLDKLNPELVQGKEILLVIGTRDDGVPTVNQNKLKAAFPSAKVITHDSDHFSTIVKSFLFDYYPIKSLLK